MSPLSGRTTIFYVTALNRYVSNSGTAYLGTRGWGPTLDYLCIYMRACLSFEQNQKKSFLNLISKGLIPPLLAAKFVGAVLYMDVLMPRTHGPLLQNTPFACGGVVY